MLCGFISRNLLDCFMPDKDEEQPGRTSTSHIQTKKKGRLSIDLPGDIPLEQPGRPRHNSQELATNQNNAAANLPHDDFPSDIPLEQPGHLRHNSQELATNQNNAAANLPSDILLVIFAKNTMLYPLESFSFTDNNDYRGCSPSFNTLLYLRHVSQICSAWRTLVLQSSVLWARAIDLNHLCRPARGAKWTELASKWDVEELDDADEWLTFSEFGAILWIKEVLRRTQSLPLWVAGNVGHSAMKLPLNYILRKEWHRVQRVQLHIDYKIGMNMNAFDDLINRPAPFLQQFYFEINSRRNIWDAPPPSSAFGNYAPLLTHITVASFPIDQRTVWLATIRHLRIKIPISYLAIVQILMKAPLLESLQVENVTDTRKSEIDSAKFLPYYIHHPKLRHIELSMHLSCAPLLLPRIIPSLPCSILIFSRETHIEPLNVDALVECAKRFVTQQISTYRISLTISSMSTLIIKLMGCDGAPEQRHGHQFYLNVSFYAQEWDTTKQNMTTLIEGFSCEDITSGATEFEYKQLDDSSKVILDGVVHSIAPLLYPSIKVLIVQWHHLASFLRPHLYKGISPVLLADIFPRLHTVRLWGTDLKSYDIEGGDTVNDLLTRLLSVVINKQSP